MSLLTEVYVMTITGCSEPLDEPSIDLLFEACLKNHRWQVTSSGKFNAVATVVKLKLGDGWLNLWRITKPDMRIIDSGMRPTVYRSTQYRLSSQIKFKVCDRTVFGSNRYKRICTSMKSVPAYKELTSEEEEETSEQGSE